MTIRNLRFTDESVSIGIEGVTTTFMGSLNVYDILKHDVMVISKDAVSEIEEVYGNE